MLLDNPTKLSLNVGNIAHRHLEVTHRMHALSRNNKQKQIHIAQTMEDDQITEKATNRYGVVKSTCFKWCEATQTLKRRNSWSGFLESYQSDSPPKESNESEQTYSVAPLNPAFECADLEKTLEGYKELLISLEEEMESIPDAETQSDKEFREKQEQDRERLVKEKKRIM